MRFTFRRKTDRIEKAAVYTGPMTPEDVNLSTWTEFFHRGGALNQPAWLQKDALAHLRRQFEFLAGVHTPIEKT